MELQNSKTYFKLKYYEIPFAIFLNIAQSKATIMPCSVNNFKMIQQMK